MAGAFDINESQFTLGGIRGEKKICISPALSFKSSIVEESDFFHVCHIQK